jgi:hypothetical protein
LTRKKGKGKTGGGRAGGQREKAGPPGLLSAERHEQREAHQRHHNPWVRAGLAFTFTDKASPPNQAEREEPDGASYMSQTALRSVPPLVNSAVVCRRVVIPGGATLDPSWLGGNAKPARHVKHTPRAVHRGCVNSQHFAKAANPERAVIWGGGCASLLGEKQETERIAGVTCACDSCMI